MENLNLKKASVFGALMLSSSLILAGCGTPSTTKQAKRNCNTWVTQEDNSEKCTDEKSSNFGHYLYAGSLYNSRNALQNSSDYKANAVNQESTSSQGSSTSKSDSNGAKSEKGTTGKGGNNNGLKGGFGSGSKGSGAS